MEKERIDESDICNLAYPSCYFSRLALAPFAPLTTVGVWVWERKGLGVKEEMGGSGFEERAWIEIEFGFSSGK